jgi:hypothetical protein
VSAVVQPFGLFLLLVGMAIVGGSPFLYVGGVVVAIGAVLITVCREEKAP